MYPLIEIKSVPIEIKVKTTNASLEYVRGTAEMEVSRSDNGGLNIKSRPIKVDMDAFRPRGSGSGTMPRGVARSAGGGTQSVGSGAQTYQATATYSHQGQELTLDARLSQNQNVAAPVTQNVPPQQMNVATVEMLPQTVSDGLEDGTMQIRYEMDKLNFDWKIDRGEFKFTPGDIEIIVEQHPSVTIKYVGGPIYVPPSADPNYEPVDVKA